MFIRNGLRIYANNFIVALKHFVFIALVLGFSVGFFIIAARPIARLLESSGWVGELQAFFESFYSNPRGIGEGFRSVATNLYLVLFNNFSAVWGNYLLVLVLVIIAPNLLFNVGEYVVGELLNKKSTALLSASYTYSLVSTLKASILYSLWKMLLSIPFSAIAIGLLYAYGVLANTLLNATLLLPLLVALLLLLLAVRFTFFIGFLPVSVNSVTINPIKNFIEGFDKHTNFFFRKLVHAFSLFVMELGAVLIVGIFTVGIGLIVAIPSVIVVNIACSLASYYAEKKINFYSSEGTIVKPL